MNWDVFITSAITGAGDTTGKSDMVPVALMTGLGQVAFTSVIGFGIGLALGLDTATSLCVAVALTFSGMIIIVKLLSDKRKIDSLHGRIALGFLIVQDLVVVLAMIALSAAGVGAKGDAAASDVALIFGSGIAMLVVVGFFIRYVAEPLVSASHVRRNFSSASR